MTRSDVNVSDVTGVIYKNTGETPPLPSRVIAAITLAVCVLVFFSLPVYQEFLIFDDPVYVVENRHVNTGLTFKNVLWALTALEASNWHPVTWLSHMLDCQIFGLDAQGHHLINVVLHTFNTILVLILMYAGTGEYWKSIFVSALFGLHPLHVESVAWISERKDLLGALFWLITWILYTRYARHPRSITYILAILTFATGLMAKPMLVTVPFVLLLWDYWPLGRLRVFGRHDKGYESGTRPRFSSEVRSAIFRLVLEKIPFLFLSVASCIITMHAQYTGDAVAELRAVPIAFRVYNALISYVRYLGKTIWPLDLAVFYPLPDKLTLIQGSMAGVFLMGVSVLCCRFARKRPYLFTGWFFYLGTLIPVIGLVQVGQQAMADRYTYIPLIGLFTIVSWEVPDVLRHNRYRRAVLSIAGSLVLITLTTATWLQLNVWKNNLTLFEHASKVTKNNYFAHRMLGSALAQAGRFDHADLSFQAALRIRPADDVTYVMWGLALMKQERNKEAMKCFNTALQFNPESAEANYNLGVLLARDGWYWEAITHFNETKRISPKWETKDLNTNLGNVYMELNRIEEASIHYEEAFRADPDDALANYNMGYVLGIKGELDKSIMFFTAALRVQPVFPEAHYNLGIALVRAGKLGEGIVQFREALRDKPDFNAAKKALEAAVARDAGGLFPNGDAEPRRKLR